VKPFNLAIAAGFAAVMSISAASAADITGAGSTFIQPVFAKWADTYKKNTGTGVNYGGGGSGAGISQVEAKTVTFGATDKPLSDDDLTKNGLVQFPMIMGGIVPIINIDGVDSGKLVLDASTLANIFLGKITKWNDPAIAALNDGLKLPDAPIVSVHRADGSGTTFNFTDFLGKGSQEWADQIGSDTAVEWPGGVGAKGSAGVAAAVKQTAGSIGYVEYSYAVQNKVAYAIMKNAAGKVVEPNLDTFAAAAANADWANAKNFHVIITNQPGDTSWPIAASTWVLIHKQPDNPAAVAEALKFFDWALKNGKDEAKGLDYVSIPDSVVALIEKSWSDVTADGKPVFAAQ
jgi:phosphate transport system substrate-binding protein